MKCSIRKREFTGFGNNAYPMNEGECCDECNFNIVLPKRLEKLRGKKNG